MTECWLEVRLAYEQAIKKYTDLAARHNHRRQRVLTARAEIIEILRHSTRINDPGLRDILTGLTDSAERLGVLGQLMVMTADKAKDYLKDVDPDNANGATDGLKLPTPSGPFLGGHQDSTGGPPVPPARQRLEDNSRNRTYVYIELGIAGLRDLISRGQELIAWRKRYLDASGHGRLRHGGHSTVSDQQLKDRIEQEKDPITGTEIDWETGREHSYSGPHVTAFVDDADLVWAEMMAVGSKAGKRKRRSVNDRGGVLYSMIMPAVDVFGPDFRDHIRGYSKTPNGVEPTVFPDNTLIRTIYRRGTPDGEWRPETCHPILP